MARILLVEDDPILQFLLQKVLEQGGHSPELARDGSEAMASIDAGLPELVLLDIMLPDISGFELLETWRSRYDLLALPIIMLSAKSAPADILRALNSGANDYVVKPAHHQELKARIEVQLHIQRLLGNRFIEIQTTDT